MSERRDANDATIERLARVGNDTYWASDSESADYLWDGKWTDACDREDWREVVRAILAEFGAE